MFKKPTSTEKKNSGSVKKKFNFVLGSVKISISPKNGLSAAYLNVFNPTSKLSIVNEFLSSDFC